MGANGKKRNARPDDAGLVRATRSINFAAAILTDAYLAALKGDGRLARTKTTNAGEFIKEAQREINAWRGRS